MDPSLSGPTRFVLDVTIDTDDPAVAAAELGRVLRHWGGAMKQLDLGTPAEQAVHDSAYAAIGSWTWGPAAS